jgi:hypothetical protein
MFSPFLQTLQPQFKFGDLVQPQRIAVPLQLLVLDLLDAKVLLQQINSTL